MSYLHVAYDKILWKEINRRRTIVRTIFNAYKEQKGEINHFYWPTNAFNCIKLNRLKST